RAGRSRPFTRGFFTVSSMLQFPSSVGLSAGGGRGPSTAFGGPPPLQMQGRRNGSGEGRSSFGDAPGRVRRERFERRLEALVDHAGADVGPARGLVLLRDDVGAVRQLAADRLFQRIHVE